MSVMNIIGSFLNYDYPAIFLVRTPLMTQAEADNGFFAAEVHLKAIESPKHSYHLPIPAVVLGSDLEDDGIRSILNRILIVTPFALSA